MALVAVIGAMLTPVPAAPAVSKAHLLKGQTRVTASKTSSVLIRFPKKVRFSKDFIANFSGDGRVRGFVLLKEGRYGQEAKRPLIQGISVGRCSERACRAARDDFNFTFGWNVGRGLTGTWRLLVIADGAPVTVTLDLKGVAGSQRLSPARREKAEIRTLTPSVHESGTNTIYSAGDFTNLMRADLGLVGLWAEGGPYGSSWFGDCIYEEGSTPPQEGLAFMPGCPTSDGSQWMHGSPSLGTGGFVFTSSRHCCPAGLGGWYATASAVKNYGGIGLWLDW